MHLGVCAVEIGNLQEAHGILQRDSPSKSCTWGQKAHPAEEAGASWQESGSAML